jgi:hypothetical protein
MENLIFQLTEQERLSFAAVADIQKAENSFYEFVRQAWPIIESGTPFVDGWHIQAICEHLEAVILGQIPNLLINVPPRTMKSTLTSVLFMPWVWIKYPHKKFLFASYAQKLSTRDSVACRRLIMSSWYQERWGHIFHIAKDQNEKMRFQNDKNGYRIATSVGGTVVGEGGDIKICLPHDALIETDKGTLKIGDIVEDEIECMVLSYNHEREEIEFESIQGYERNPIDYNGISSYELHHVNNPNEYYFYEQHRRDILQIETEDGLLECTGDHPVWVEGRGYTPACDVRPGDALLILR